MKNTHKILASGATSAFLLSAAVIPTFAALEPAGGPLDDLLNNVATETAENTALKVQNLSVLSSNGKATLMWDPVKNTDSSFITKYKISYGSVSVEEGLAEDYDDSMKLELNADELTTVGVARSEISGLTNGQKYFFVVQAIDEEGNTGAKSEEGFTTPSLIAQEVAEESEMLLDLELQEATALTTTIVKATLSNEVVLPEDEELRKKSFVLNLKADETVTFEIKDVVFRDNYLRGEDSAAEEITEGAEIYILLEEAVEKDIEYQLTASARLKDTEGKSIDNGVADNVFFSGTDVLVLPETEKLDDVAVSDSAADSAVDPLAALLGGSAPEPVDTPVEPTGTEVIAEEQDMEEEPLHSAPRDITAPEDVTNLRANIVKRITDFVVNLTWTKSKNTAGDLVQQLLYTSVDQGNTWGEPRKFDGDLEEYVFTGKPDTSYTVKVTTKDRSGNESEGVIKTIKVPELVSSGAPLFLALGLALLGGGARVARRKK